MNDPFTASQTFPDVLTFDQHCVLFEDQTLAVRYLFRIHLIEQC